MSSAVRDWQVELALHEVRIARSPRRARRARARGPRGLRMFDLKQVRILPRRFGQSSGSVSVSPGDQEGRDGGRRVGTASWSRARSGSAGRDQPREPINAGTPGRLRGGCPEASAIFVVKEGRAVSCERRPIARAIAVAPVVAPFVILSDRAGTTSGADLARRAASRVTEVAQVRRMGQLLSATGLSNLPDRPRTRATTSTQTVMSTFGDAQ
jgi:hypothetical protein